MMHLRAPLLYTPLLVAARTAILSSAFVTPRSGQRPSSRLASSPKMKELAEGVLRSPKFPPEWPYSPEDFMRQDESNDGLFYEQARLVYHIDDPCVAALTDYYKTALKDGDSVLDICSSWVSHYPAEFKGKNVVGLGMNEYELSQNKQLDSFVVKDLNSDCTFPFDDETFDKVTCVVSVDYLNKPRYVTSSSVTLIRASSKSSMSIDKYSTK